MNYYKHYRLQSLFGSVKFLSTFDVKFQQKCIVSNCIPTASYTVDITM